MRLTKAEFSRFARLADATHEREPAGQGGFVGESATLCARLRELMRWMSPLHLQYWP